MSAKQKNNKNSSKNSFFSSKKFYFMLIICFPLLIHIFYKIKVPENFITVSEWDCKDILEYGSSIISSLIVYFSVIMTISENKDENDKLIKSTIQENKKIIVNSQNEKKFENYTKSLSKIIGLLVKLDIPDFFNPIIPLKKENVEKVFSGLNDNLDNVAIEYAMVEISLLTFNREYFTTKLKDSYTSFISQYKIYLISYNSKKKQYFDSNDFFLPNIFEKDFKKLSQNAITARATFIHNLRSIGFAISDYYFDETKFKKDNNNVYKLDSVLHEYGPLYADMLF